MRPILFVISLISICNKIQLSLQHLTYLQMHLSYSQILNTVINVRQL